ncbi:LytTR family transcriptional regulator [Bacteroides sp. 214]|uniref:LytTR family transcriptional regulator DNA-binding domain-containing protein n=1 Tax=Bacteroides sp. 214 TaxID=2302935 RepID=UPI0013D1B504|nr:LytTR family transcriptional regulator DNA-binding domain-containing protein [Bacteroides sp. 214]NDW13068.1 LytTR family transcriptional regulator [Bacteroides sp. 214]
MWNQKIPNFILEKRVIVRLILLTALFALVFINLYKPFESSNWYPVSDFKFFVFSSLIILTGVLVVVISRIIMYYWGKRHTINVRQYVIWIVLELFSMSLFYTIYTLSLNPEREWLSVFKSSSINTALVLLLPYSALHLYFLYRDNLLKLQQMEGERGDAGSQNNVYSFYDERNELRLSVHKNNLLYIETADNYVNIWYMNKDHLTKFMLRNSLKSIEERMRNSTVLRCHRSYMANFALVKVIRRQNDGIYLEFSIGGVPDIPISKSYSEKITRWFMTYSS